MNNFKSYYILVIDVLKNQFIQQSYILIQDRLVSMGRKIAINSGIIPKFQRFQIVWGKLSGYPWWPGRIIDVILVDAAKIPNGDLSRVRSVAKIKIREQERSDKAVEDEIKRKFIYKVEFIKENTYALLDCKTIHSYFQHWHQHAYPKNCPFPQLFQQAKNFADEIMNINNQNNREVQKSLQDQNDSKKQTNNKQKPFKIQGIKENKNYGINHNDKVSRRNPLSQKKHIKMGQKINLDKEQYDNDVKQFVQNHKKLRNTSIASNTKNMRQDYKRKKQRNGSVIMEEQEQQLNEDSLIGKNQTAILRRYNLHKIDTFSKRDLGRNKLKWKLEEQKNLKNKLIIKIWKILKLHQIKHTNNSITLQQEATRLGNMFIETNLTQNYDSIKYIKKKFHKWLKNLDLDHQTQKKTECNPISTNLEREKDSKITQRSQDGLRKEVLIFSPHQS